MKITTQPTNNGGTGGKNRLPSVLLTGEALARIVKLNPTREEIIEIKGLENIADRILEPNYSVLLGGKEFTKLEFLMEVDPNSQVKLPEPVATSYVNFPIFISKSLDFTRDGGKCQVIDSHLNSAWVPYDASKTPGEIINDLIDSDTEKFGWLKRVDVDTARWAKSGEVQLYEFLFGISNLSRKDAADGTRFEMSLGENLSEAHKAFDRIVDGDLTELNEFLNSPSTMENGKRIPVGIFLGVRRDGDKFYQEVYTSSLVVPIFRHYTKPRSHPGGMMFRLSTQAVNGLIRKEYPWKHIWNGPELGVFDKTSVLSNQEDTTPKTSNLPF